MMVEHLDYYFQPGNPKNIMLLRCLRAPERPPLEKQLLIWSMHQLKSWQDSYQVDTAYRELIEYACGTYRNGRLLLPLLEGLFVCPFQISENYPQYPFFILDFKFGAKKALLFHQVLDALIALPTIPCGLKKMARKAKNGTLATKQEMAYMQGYQEFRKTHFTLYETIPPRK